MQKDNYEIGDTTTRNGIEFVYQGSGYWTRSAGDAQIVGTVPLPDGASTSANQVASGIKQAQNEMLMTDLLDQMRKTNLHLSIITDEEIKDTEKL